MTKPLDPAIKQLNAIGYTLPGMTRDQILANARWYWSWANSLPVDYDADTRNATEEKQ